MRKNGHAIRALKSRYETVAGTSSPPVPFPMCLLDGPAGLVCRPEKLWICTGRGRASSATSVGSVHAVSDFEATSYYLGVSDHPLLLFRISSLR
jgi:hypothetical protein